MVKKHHCESVVLHCIDYRIQRFLNKYLEGRTSGNYDRIAVAGGVKNLPLDQIEVSVRLHQPHVLILIQHEDCGAYGGSDEFIHLEAEKDFQRQELRKTEEILTNMYPGMAVERFFVMLSEQVVAV